MSIKNSVHQASIPTADGRFLPMTREEMDLLGWDECDFIIISGDAYVDHPAFGTAIIGRILQAEGFRVGIIAQPDWNESDELKILGRPRLAFLVTSGNMDSMVNHYTAAGRLRHNDSYTPGGSYGARPDRATIVYSNLAREAYKGVQVILGGIEASLRRLAHYDYWSNKLRRSVLLDSKADLLIYGMAERSIAQVAGRLNEGVPAAEIRDLPGTVYRLTATQLKEFSSEQEGREKTTEPVKLPSFEEVKADKAVFARSFSLQMQHADPYSAAPLMERYGRQAVVQNPPDFPLSQAELDRVYELPYTRRAHPTYRQEVPALREVEFSLVSSRGCFGGCSFCALTFHQGRIVQGRSRESLLREAEQLISLPDFKGYIHDVGGPTANFREPACDRQKKYGACSHRQCLFPEPCPQLKADHREYIGILRSLRSLEGVKKVFIRSGIRFDYLLADQRDGGQAFLRELCEHHISGQLKIAPEHVSDRVLYYMGKSKKEVYLRFMAEYEKMNTELGKKQYLVPYFIAAHPGSRLEDAVELAEFCRDQHFIPKQVQEFYPTPGTVATCMYYTGIDPRSMEPVYVARGGRERRLQRALLQYNRRENYPLVREALEKTGRSDLIGHGPKALIPPFPPREEGSARSPQRKEAPRRKGASPQQKAKSGAKRKAPSKKRSSKKRFRSSD